MPDMEKLMTTLQYRINEARNKGSKVTTIFISTLSDCMTLLKEQEAKYGYWINPTSQDCHCSECGEQPVHEPGEYVPLYDYCPYCGAKMEAKWE